MNFFKPFTAQQAASHFDQYFRKIQAKSPSRPLQVRVYSEKLGLDYAFPAGSGSQPYHIASIGKVFTAVVIQILAERGALSLQDFIAQYFSSAELDRLFLYQGTDYAGQVTIEHLLGHTSGIADYFEGISESVEAGKTTRKSFIDEVLTHPNHRWTPQELLEYTRTYQKAVGIPGQVFQYSDTGYILLGLIIEKVSGKSFAENLVDDIFLPLEMNDSHLVFYSEPVNESAKKFEKLWLKNVEASSFESISCDWAGGGIASTTADLLKFNQALRSGQLIKPGRLEAMDRCIYRFQPGIYYGLGMMEIRFKEFFFLLGHLPKARGHIGILATHMFYDPLKETHVVMNFGDSARMVESFQALIEIENTLQKIK